MTRRFAFRKVAFASSLVHDLSSSGDAEGLLRATVRFHLWHIRVLSLVGSLKNFIRLLALRQRQLWLFGPLSALPLLRSSSLLVQGPLSYCDPLAWAQIQ